MYIKVSYHRLIPKKENSCSESHVFITPAYVENDEEYSEFLIIKNEGDKIFVADLNDKGVYLKLSEVYKEIDEILPLYEQNPNDKLSILAVRLIKVYKYLPEIISLERIRRFPNRIIHQN